MDEHPTAPSPMDENSPDHLAQPSPFTLADFIPSHLLQTSPKRHLYHKHSSKMKNNKKPPIPQIVGNPMKMNLRGRKKLPVIPEEELLLNVAVVHKDLGSKNEKPETEIESPTVSESHTSTTDLVLSQAEDEGRKEPGERDVLFSFPPAFTSPEVVEAVMEVLPTTEGAGGTGYPSSVPSSGAISPSKASSTVRKKIVFPVIFSIGKNGNEQTGGDTPMEPQEESDAQLQHIEVCQEVSRAEVTERSSIPTALNCADDASVLSAGERDVTSHLPVGDVQQKDALQESTACKKLDQFGAGLEACEQIAENGSAISPTLKSQKETCLIKNSIPAHASKDESTISATFPDFWSKKTALVLEGVQPRWNTPSVVSPDETPNVWHAPLPTTSESCSHPRQMTRSEHDLQFPPLKTVPDSNIHGEKDELFACYYNT